MRAKRRGLGPSRVLITPDHAGGVVGVDPPKQTLTATVVDPRGGIVGGEHVRVSGDGHRALEAWARQLGLIARWGVEGASRWGRHTAMFLTGRGYDVRDVHPLLAKAFKRAAGDSGPDEQHQRLARWHHRRRLILASRQHLVNEAESLLCELGLDLREQLPTATRSGLGSPRWRAATAAGAPTRRRACACGCSTTTAGRSPRWTARRRRSSRTCGRWCKPGSTLGELCGRATRSVAELLVEVGDPRRFTQGGFARFNASAPLPAATAERPGERPGEPVRHRSNPAGNRPINAILHRMAVTQLRGEPRAQAIFANAPAHGHTKNEARRILKRHLSDVIYRRMTRDLASHSAQPLLAA